MASPDLVSAIVSLPRVSPLWLHTHSLYKCLSLTFNKQNKCTIVLPMLSSGSLPSVSYSSESSSPQNRGKSPVPASNPFSPVCFSNHRNQATWALPPAYVWEFGYFCPPPCCWLGCSPRHPGNWKIPALFLPHQCLSLNHFVSRRQPEGILEDCTSGLAPLHEALISLRVQAGPPCRLTRSGSIWAPQPPDFSLTLLSLVESVPAILASLLFLEHF